jgi:hypothetical protein
MRKALVVGIDHYDFIDRLFGCVQDAHAVAKLLQKHDDGSTNFGVMLLTATGASDSISRAVLKSMVDQLFKGDSDVALFYFAGHGHIEATGGYLCGSDCKRGDDGLSLGELMTLARKSGARNKVIILDSCFSGIAGSHSFDERTAELCDGMTILTASTQYQYAEENGSGVFTTLLVDALNGAACNLVGDITPGSVYAHIDQSLGPWKQRPVFRANVNKFVSLRKVKPPIALGDLQRITEFFPTPGYLFQLDPTFEPETAGRPANAAAPERLNTAKFSILQNYYRVNLVEPVDAPHMWHAAMNSKGCKLTVLGEHYRRLVEDKLI